MHSALIVFGRSKPGPEDQKQEQPAKLLLGGWVCLTLITLFVLNSGCVAGQKQAAQETGKPTVHAVLTDVEPIVDGRDDVVWDKAPATSIKMLQTGEVVKVKALYTKQRIYVQAQYPDATHDYIDRPWVFDGTKWKQKGQQDSLCFIWNINDSISGFNEHGFSVLTQGLEDNRHPWEIEINGGKSQQSPAWFRSQKGDFWSMGLQLPYGKAEDWVLKVNTSVWENGDWRIRILNQHDAYLDSVPWVLNKADDWSHPIWMLRPGLTINDDPYPVSANMVDITGHTPAAGEVQPFIIYRTRQARWGGSKDDIDGAEQWASGRWTVEMGRKLNTGHDDDIQFAPSKGTTYTFGLLVRRNGSRYEPTGPVKLVFDQR